MKYLIAILSVLGLITIGTMLTPFVVDGVEFAKARYSSAVGRVEGPVPTPVPWPDMPGTEESEGDEQTDPIYTFSGCVRSFQLRYLEKGDFPGPSHILVSFKRLGSSGLDDAFLQITDGSPYFEVAVKLEQAGWAPSVKMRLSADDDSNSAHNHSLAMELASLLKEAYREKRSVHLGIPNRLIPRQSTGWISIGDSVNC